MSEEQLTRAVLTTDGRVLVEQPDGSFRPSPGQTDWRRLDAMSEEEVERNAAEEMAELGLDEDWAESAQPAHPRPKPITVRLDPDVLDWFKAQGEGYQHRIQAVLRAFYEANR